MPRRALDLVVPTLILILVLPLAASASAGPRVPSAATRGPWGDRVPEMARVASRFAIARNDGNDVRGALDLRSMKIARGRTKDAISFSTHDPVSNASIDPDDGNFAVLIDTNDNRKYDFGQYVFFAAGRIRGILVNLRTDRLVDRTVPASRSNPRAFRTVIQRGKIDSPGTYRFALFAYNEARPCTRRRPCLDTIPNRFPLIPLDHKAPSVDVDPMAAYATDVSDDLTSPVSFDFDDDRFGTGVRRWIVQRRPVDGTDWEMVRKGTISSPTVDVDGEQGTTYDVRVVVVDRHKNEKISGLRRTSFPFDDRNPIVSYTGTTVQNAVPGSFLDTTTSLENGSSASLTFSGEAEVCVIGGPVGTGLTATADIELDAVFQVTETENEFTEARARLTCLAVSGAGNHTIELTGTSATPFVLDGIYVIP